MIELAIGSDWRLIRDGVVLWSAPAAQVDRLVETLGIAPVEWQEVLRAYAAHPDALSTSLAARLAALGEGFASIFPSLSPTATAATTSSMAPCPVCGGPARPDVARRAAGASIITWSRCQSCRHLFTAPVPTSYAGQTYYARQDEGGVGYPRYDAERAYRTAKAHRLLSPLGPPPPGARLLDVGCGYGFLLAAARELGYEITGLDLNQHAAERAARELGAPVRAMPLRDCVEELESSFAVVTYQFVLEHLDDPVAELALVRRVLTPDGRLLLLVPNAEATELAVFGGAYRSLRADHTHLFSRSSLERTLTRAGLRLVAARTECNIHLLRGFASDADLQALYDAGCGPDWIAVAALA